MTDTTALTPDQMRAGDEQPRCTDPAELRQRAQDSHWRATLAKIEAGRLEREGGQFEYEAALWEACDAAEDALGALQERTAGLEAAEEGTTTAERAAQDRLREDRKHHARRKAEVTRSENSGSRDAQDEAQVRLHRSERRVAEAEADLETATAKRKAAEVALDVHRTALRGAQAVYARALDAGFNPGTAPLKGFTPGITGLSDMSDDARDALKAAGLLAYAASGSGTSQAPAKGSLGTSRREFEAQDPSKFRLVRSGSGVVAVPPHWTGTQPR
jgi:hypothetical protein